MLEGFVRLFTLESNIGYALLWNIYLASLFGSGYTPSGNDMHRPSRLRQAKRLS
ncbi:hypothetical protein K491DRAFT_759475 [Lophiostoma macrostomum CBS 122681]|uniref:Uncharacterized protein n=1 Tax=Lophiostoma macrostomum CBS 122681 TaxID=1314788 RepID=A0A6A6T1U6_9PLEO|nr:hypothetical protein K491DRAFT_759475 [Lophiostoma macrostomum CBS 122681]